MEVDQHLPVSSMDLIGIASIRLFFWVKRDCKTFHAAGQYPVMMVGFCGFELEAWLISQLNVGDGVD
jgi:hypothetical protein